MDFSRHLLSVIIFAPLVGAIAVMAVPRQQRKTLMWVALLASLVPLAASLAVLAGYDPASGLDNAFRFRRLWIPGLGVHYDLGVDGLSLPLIILTALTTPLCLAYSWNVEDRTKEYFALFLLLEVGMMGTFLALDFFLFYVFWEISLVPMYFIIGVWGGPRREYAAIKFFLYTLVGSVAMLLAIIYLYIQTGTFSFVEMARLDPMPGPSLARFLVFWAFFLGFAIKVPSFPFHTWLPDAHVEAPTAGSVVLAGVLLKMGAYGFLRIVLPILPGAAKQYWLPVAILAAISVVYGAMCAMAQWDLKKLIAYSSVNHMGYVMLGIAALCAVVSRPDLTPEQIQLARQNAVNGAMYQLVAHGLITGALFFLVGVIYDRAHTRDLHEFGGLMARTPVYAAIFTAMAFASLGLPGFAGFQAEFMVFAGSFPVIRVLTAISAIGIIVTAAYLLWTVQRMLLGPLNPRWADLPDMNGREHLAIVPLAALALVLGVFPHLVLKYLNVASADLLRFLGV